MYIPNYYCPDCKQFKNRLQITSEPEIGLNGVRVGTIYCCKKCKGIIEKSKIVIRNRFLLKR